MLPVLRILHLFCLTLGQSASYFAAALRFYFVWRRHTLVAVNFLVDFPPLVLVRGAAKTEVSAPLVLLQGASFLADCRRVGP